MIKKIKLFAFLLLLFCGLCVFASATIPDKTKDLAEKFRMTPETLQSFLKSEDKHCELIPMDKENLGFYLHLILDKSNREYMKYYFEDDFLMNNAKVLCGLMTKSLNMMWEPGIPKTLLFVLWDTSKNVRLGIFHFELLGHLRGPTVGFVIEKSYTHQGYATLGLEKFIDLLRNLKSTGIYQINRLIAICKLENQGARTVLQKAKFSHKLIEDNMLNYTLQL